MASSGNYLSTDSNDIEPKQECNNILTTNYPTSKIYFPSDVLKWMKKNAKPKMALKLMHVCKYFQHQKFPYFVVKDVSNLNNAFYYQKLTRSYVCNTLNGRAAPDDYLSELRWNKFEDIPNNLWITKSLFSTTRQYPKARFISRLTLKIAVCEAKILHFSHEKLTLNEFNFLASCGILEELNLSNTFIYDENNQTMPLEYFLKCFPALQSISIEDMIPSFSSVEVANEIVLPNLKASKLIDITKDFNIEAFVEFMKNHKIVKYTFYFICNLSTENVRRIQAYADEIGEGNSLKFPLTYVELPGQTKKESNETA